MPQSLQMKRLDFLFFDAGGGHRAAAHALRQVIEQQGLPYEIRPVNLQEILDSIDVFRKVTGIRLQDLYNVMLKKGWTLGAPQLARGMQQVIRMFHGPAVRTLEAYWRESRPDMIVSLVPNLNRAIYESVTRALPGVPMVGILTDIADWPPHFWIERQEQHFICGSETAVEQAREMGHDESRIHRVSGMILNPAFYNIAPMSPEDRAAARGALGLEPNLPTGLVLFGGQGSAVMMDIARRLPDRQLIFICGHNAKLRAKLQALPHERPTFVEGFTKEIPRYMQLADYFIGKPGPGSVSEAVAMRLPVIVERNIWTLPQERYNADWVLENGFGLVLPNFRNIAAAVEQLTAPGAYEKFRAATERHQNRAVFEIPAVLETILAGSESQARK